MREITYEIMSENDETVVELSSRLRQETLKVHVGIGSADYSSSDLPVPSVYTAIVRSTVSSAPRIRCKGGRARTESLTVVSSPDDGS
jgi:hypothetical protein